MEIIWLFGGYDFAQPPPCGRKIIPAEAGIHLYKFSFFWVGKIDHERLLCFLAFKLGKDEINERYYYIS